MERISVFDIFKIGIGPSSSHTMGPWRAALAFLDLISQDLTVANQVHINVILYGSLAKTGKGHGTDMAVILGLSGFDPVTVSTDKVQEVYGEVHSTAALRVNNLYQIPFDPNSNIAYLGDRVLPYHSNSMTFVAHIDEKEVHATYYSVGGGFVVKEGEENKASDVQMPYPIDQAKDLKDWCGKLNLTIPQVVMQNELALRSEQVINDKLFDIWDVMKTCIFHSCQKDGVLPGGLNVERRAKGLSQKLLNHINYKSCASWMQAIKDTDHSFQTTLKWLSCFALAVNEENASYGRVVTAPTNGAAGVIPAVLMHHMLFSENAHKHDVIDFFLTAGEIGSLFKKGATISAAMGGCQAEIGVSSAMAAAALTQVLGGSYDQVMMAAEIAMEHHLGMTCDPIGGLVQIPCIERNTMGAIKAITAAQIAMESDPSKAKVSLDAVIKTMKDTADDMNLKYKETADGGLAIHIPVNIVEC